VDDILLILDSNHSNIQEILKDFNSIHPKLQLTAETVKEDHTLNFLDISIHRTPTSIKTTIFSKPTFTDNIIPFISNHPAHHKYATVKFVYNRLENYNLQQKEYLHELNIIHNILHNNSFPIDPQKHKHPTHYPAKQTAPKQKWATFTYVGRETSYITNIFRLTELKISFRTTNNLNNLLTHKHQTHDKFSLSGVYKLVCPDSKKTYVGQTGRKFSSRYKEHKIAFRNNSNTSSFAKHLIQEAHSFGPVSDVIQIVHCHRKGAHLNTIERFHTHTEFAASNHLNDPQTIFPKAIFSTLLKANRP
jgi:hypothetical protein